MSADIELPEGPKSLDNAVFQLFIATLAMIGLFIVPELKHSPAEVQASNILIWLVSVGIWILTISKLSSGKTWARIVLIASNIAIIFFIVILYFVADDTDKSNIVIAFWAFAFLILSTNNLLNKDTKNWFEEIRSQTSLKDRTREFIPGYSIVAVISIAANVFYEIDILEYVNSAYDAVSKLTYYQSLTYSTLTGNTEGKIITIGVIMAIGQIAILWAYYFIAFVAFGFVSEKTKQSVQVASNYIGNDTTDDSSYYYAYKEIESNKTNKILWAKAFALSDGDLEKQKSIYVKLRAKEIDEKNK
jgi:hypothetical protein